MGQANRIESRDTYVNAASPNTNYYGAKRLGLRKWDAADAQYAFVNFSKPFNTTVKVMEGTLSFYTYAMPEGGTHSITVSLVTTPTSYSAMTWNNGRPDVHTDSQITVTKTGALPGATLWEVDVRPLLQRISNGASWFGFRITTNDSQQRWIYSDEEASTTAEGPRLSVRWSDAPYPPSSLSPDEGVVGTDKPSISFNYVDVSANTRLSQAQIQTSTSTSFAAPAWDSGKRDASSATVSLSSFGYPGAPAGQKVYYRLRVADGDEEWSGWSPVAWFIYQPQAVPTLTSPSPTDLRFVDSTPQLTWSVSTQKAYQVLVSRTANPRRVLWNTGRKNSGGTRTIEIPKGVLRWDDVSYRVEIRIWDDENRVPAANSLTYRRIVVDIKLDVDAATTPVTSVTSVGRAPLPYIDVKWTRPVAADEYEIVREVAGEQVILDRIAHADAIRQDGTFNYRDYGAPGHTNLRHIVRPVTNRKRAGGTGGAAVRNNIEGIWLLSETRSLCISGNEQGTWSIPESSTEYQVIGAASPTIISEAPRGYVINLSGLLIQEDKYQASLTAQQKRDVYYWFKTNAERKDIRLAVADVNIPVRLSAMEIAPTPYYDLRYEVSFTAYQTGEVQWSLD